MPQPRAQFIFLLPVLLLPFAAPGAPIPILLREHLGMAWTNEVVTYTVDAPAGTVIPGPAEVAGPSGPVPAQLSAAVPPAKGARLSILVDHLDPFGTNTYTVATTSPGADKVAKSDLVINPTANQVEFATARFGIRVPLGEKTFDKPAPIATVAGPVASMRLADGTWFGGSALWGSNLAVKSWSGRLVDRGPVFARAEVVYRFEGGDSLKVEVRLNAKDDSALLDVEVRGEHRDAGWNLLLNQEAEIREGIRYHGARQYAKEVPFAVTNAPDAVLCTFSPWVGEGWFPGPAALARFKLANHPGSLYASVRDVGAWVEPVARPFWSDFTKWGIYFIDTAWAGWRQKMVPVVPDGSGVALRIDLAPGLRKLAIGHTAEEGRLMDVFQIRATGAHTPMPRLDVIKDMVLEWTDTPEKHPSLLMTPEEFRAAGERNPKSLATLQDTKGLRTLLDQVGVIDWFRRPQEIAFRYDALIDSGLFSPAERNLIRARTAFLTYLVADPFHWSFERGFCSGNPNMTVSRIYNAGILGLALRDHPKSRAWAEYAAGWMRYWLDEVVADTGSWPESSHYARVSLADYAVFAIAARKTGICDFLSDPKLQRFALFYEKTLTPPNPFRAVVDKSGSIAGTAPRVDAPYGRGTRGDLWALSGLFARATAKSAPEFSRVMAWSWKASAFNESWSHSSAGMFNLYTDRELPTEIPKWESEEFPHLGYILRDRVGQPDEDYLLFVSHSMRSVDGEIWPPDTGTIAAWYARGARIAGNFVRIPDYTNPLLVNRVLLAANWDPSRPGIKTPDAAYTTRATQGRFSAVPRLDYASARFDVDKVEKHFALAFPTNAPAFPPRAKEGAAPYTWQRQVMVVGDDRTNGVSYLVLRDTVGGHQPTQWHFWTMSEKVGTAAEAAQRDAFLADKPGTKALPSRELKGDRFTALGQSGMDLEYFVAAPSATPRFTLRFGGPRNSAYGTSRVFEEYQDLLHLQLPDDGSYYVAMFPHPPLEAAPEFTALDNGKIIRVKGAFGTDHNFLSDREAEAKSETISFKGTSGSVQERPGGILLALGAPGTVARGDLRIESPIGASLRSEEGTLRLEFPSSHPGGAVMFHAPGNWSLGKGAPGVRLEKKGGGQVVTLPEGIRSVLLVKAP